jgi:hypothetical protein
MLGARIQSLDICYAFSIFVFNFDSCLLALLMPNAQIKIHSQSYHHLMNSYCLRNYFPAKILNLGALSAAIKLKSDPKSKEKSEINSFITIKKVLNLLFNLNLNRTMLN